MKKKDNTLIYIAFLVVFLILTILFIYQATSPSEINQLLMLLKKEQTLDYNARYVWSYPGTSSGSMPASGGEYNISVVNGEITEGPSYGYTAMKLKTEMSDFIYDNWDAFEYDVYLLYKFFIDNN